MTLLRNNCFFSLPFALALTLLQWAASVFELQVISATRVIRVGLIRCTLSIHACYLVNQFDNWLSIQMPQLHRWQSEKNVLSCLVHTRGILQKPFWLEMWRITQSYWKQWQILFCNSDFCQILTVSHAAVQAFKPEQTKHCQSPTKAVVWFN